MKLIIMLEAFGSTCAYLKILAESTLILLTHFSLVEGLFWKNVNSYIVIVSLIVIPFSFKININYFTKLSILGNILMPFFLISLLIIFGLKYHRKELIPISFDLFFRKFDVKGFITAFTAILESLVFQKSFFVIYLSLKNKKNKEMLKAFDLGVGFVSFLYGLVGSLVLLMFGRGTGDNIIGMLRTELISFQTKSIIYITILVLSVFSLALNALLSLPFVITTITSYLESLLIDLKKCNYPNPNLINLSTLKNNNSMNKEKNKKLENKEDLYKISLSTKSWAYLIIMVFIILTSVKVKNISFISYLMGATCGNFLTLIFPSLFILYLTRTPMKSFKNIINKVMVIFGTLIFIFFILALSFDKKTFEKPIAAEENYSGYNQKYDIKHVPFFTIVYSSQLGKSKHFATQLRDESISKYGVDVQLINIQYLNSINDFNENKMIVFFVSTWGKGMATDDMYSFKEMVSKEYFFDDLKNGDLVYTIFGIGNSYYEKEFNPEAKFLDDILSKSKIKKVCDIGLGDEIGDLERQFSDWKDKVFWPKIISYFNINQKLYADFAKSKHQKKFIPEEYYSLILKNRGEFKIRQLNINTYHPQVQSFINSSKVKIEKVSELKKNQEDTPILNVTYDLKGTGLKYEKGNIICVFPKNPQEEVEAVASKMGYDLDKIITYSFLNYESIYYNLNLPYPNGITIKEALTNIIDLNCQINDKILGLIRRYIPDERQFQEIRSILINKEKIKLFNSKNYNLIDFMYLYQSLNIPFEQLHKIMPRITPRLYLASNLPNLQKDKLNIKVTLVSWNNYLGKNAFGLSSSYFYDLYKTNEKKEQQNIIIRKGHFKLPKKIKTPILMICTSTGIFPFISFLEELKLRNEGPYETYLIFGSRNKEKDFLYENELKDYIEEGILTKLVTAWSRDQENKIYVQHKLEETFVNNLSDLITNKKMVIYVSGSSLMGKAIQNAIRNLIGSENYQKMMDENQFIGEFW